MDQHEELRPLDVSTCLSAVPEEVRSVLIEFPQSVVLAGGLIRATVSDEQISDIDLFTSYPEVAKEVELRLRGLGPASQRQGVATIYAKPFPIQVIVRQPFEDPAALIGSFDFTICRAALWSDGQAWRSLSSIFFYLDVAAKRLRYCSPAREEEASSGLLRVLHFYRKGYRIGISSFAQVLARFSDGAGGDTKDALALESLLRRGTPGSDVKFDDLLMGG